MPTFGSPRQSDLSKQDHLAQDVRRELAIHYVDSPTDRRGHFMPTSRMDTRLEPRIISCDRMCSGIVVSFDDGKTALYSAILLRATLSRARAIPSDSEDDWLPDNV
jgi:hypothetical protein